MSELPENAVCGIDGCGPAKPLADAPQPAQAARHEIIVVSDVICPWCYVAKRHLMQALALAKASDHFTITWLPFELNPDMPAEGMDRRTYRSRKFGSWEHSQTLDAQVTQAGARAGISFRHDLMQRTPNTLQAHRLIWFADKEGVQDAVVEAVFKAYFIEGRDVGDKQVLANLAAESGIDHAKAEAFLAGDSGSAEVRMEESTAYSAQINGVPTVIVNGEQAFSGARPVEFIASLLTQAMSSDAR